MVLFLSFFAPAVLLAILDLRPDVKARNWKTVAVYAALDALALALCFCVLRDMHLKSPSDFVSGIIKALFPPLG
jgi:hypothetical protein